MKWLKLLIPITAVLASSCTATIITEENIYETPAAAEILLEKDLWYIDMEKTVGDEEANFMQIAFTLSFDRGQLLANNNLTGIGETGNGLGTLVGQYFLSDDLLEVDHQIDGTKLMEIDIISSQQVTLTDVYTGTVYTLYGYYADEFDFEALFYDNLNYFLQEYTLWEKTYTSNYGALNDFDEENYLQFADHNGSQAFRSSVNTKNTDLSAIYWDYQGNYQVYNIPGEQYVKTLTLDYDFMYNDYFEVYVLNKNTIELFHPASGTLYQFSGRNPIRYLKNAEGTDAVKRRIRPATAPADMEVSRQGEYRSFEIE